MKLQLEFVERKNKFRVFVKLTNETFAWTETKLQAEQIIKKDKEKQ